MDEYEDDKHSTTSTKLGDEEVSIRVQLPPLRRSQEAVFRRNGNNSSDHQVSHRPKRYEFIDVSCTYPEPLKQFRLDYF